VIQLLQVGDRHVMIENHAASLNPVDNKTAATNFVLTKLPAVIDYTVSGQVVADENAVNDPKFNNKVFGFLNSNSRNGGGAF
jgi:NADPH:quinone reductase-like Zn-dependent oxidoreductase